MSMMASGSFMGMGDLEQQIQFSKFIDGQYCSVPSWSPCNALCMSDEEKPKDSYKNDEIKLFEEKNTQTGKRLNGKQILYRKNEMCSLWHKEHGHR